jgi:Bacteriophage abortive infection AbiH
MEKKVLKLFLVGNGFDLAHGLKTSYQDFITQYFIQAIRDAAENGGMYSDDLIELKCNTNIILELPETNEENKQSKFIRENLVQVSPAQLSSYNHPNPNISVAGIDLTVLVKYRKPLMTSIVRNLNSYGWVDIEYMYYLELERCLSEYKHDENKVDKLHNALKTLKGMLSNYLVSLNKPNQSRDIYHQIRRVLANKGNEILSILYVNFNYTNTINRYVLGLDADSVNVINIHGLVQNNDIIFGYGDENSQRYKEIENLNDNRFLEYAKSPNYSLNDDYKQMHAAIENCDRFDVIVLGHSCGLSDRTLLSELFGHEKLGTLMLSYFIRRDGSDNFLELVYNASRCFPDKTRFRKKLVDKGQTIPFP